MKRKLLGCVLILSFLFSAVSFVEADTQSTGGTQETAERMAVALELMEPDADGAFHAERVMTRSEGARVFGRILFGNAVPEAEGVFRDVDAESRIADALCAAGVLSPSELFRPNAELSFEQGLAMLLRTMGYEPLAEQNGGFPHGYFKIASSKRMLNGQPDNFIDSAMTKGRMAMLLYRSLEQAWLAPKSYGDKTYHEDENKTILSELDVTIVEGKITANSFSGIGGAAKAAPGYVTILSAKGGERLACRTGELVADADILNLSGRFYIRTEGDMTKTLLYADFGRLEKLIIPAAALISVSSSSIVYQAEENFREETAELDEKLAVIYNGGSILGDYGLYMQPQVGEIILYRQAGSEAYNTAYVYDYEVALAERPVPDGVLVKQGNGTATIDLSETDIARVTKDGSEAALSDVEEWDVLHLAYSADRNTVSVEISSEGKVHGMLNGFSAEEVEIDGKFYPVQKGLIESAAFGQLYGGKTAVFFHDKYNTVFAYELDEIMERVLYGYLLGMDRTTGVGSGLQFKILNEYGVVTVYGCEDKISVVTAGSHDQYTIRDGSQEECPLLFDGSDALVNQLVRFRISSDGKINKFELAQDITDGAHPLNSQGYDEGNFTLVLSGQPRYDNYNGGRFDNRYIMTSATKVYLISEDGDDTKMEVTTPSKAFAGIYKNIVIPSGEVLLYNSNEYFQPEIVVYHVQPAYTPTNDSATLVVNKIAQAVRSNGEIGFKLYGYSNGAAVSHFLSDELDAHSLKQGDMLQISTDANGIIVGMRKIYSYSDENYVESISGSSSSQNESADWRSDICVMAGNAYGVTPDGGYLVMSTDLPWDVRRGFRVSGKYYLLDTKKQEIRVASSSDLKCSSDSPQRVVVRMRRALVTDVLIID